MARKTKISPKSEIPDDPDLNGVVDAATGEPGPADLGAPEIQPGKTPSVEDAYADMSEPAPPPPVVLLVLNHSSTLPKGAFRVQPRQGGGVFLWMFAIPYGEGQAGEAFVHPIIASLRPSLLRECPALIPVRYEIRMIRNAASTFSLLEIPADPAKTKKGEATRQSLLQVIESAEKEALVAVKDPGAGGTWCSQEADSVIPNEWPKQSIKELVGTTYKADLITTMTNSVLARFRLKAKKTD
jgi:hypothetical protein